MAQLQYMSARAIEKNDSAEEVMHIVYATIDGAKYQNKMLATDPTDAIYRANNKPIIVGRDWFLITEKEKL